MEEKSIKILSAEDDRDDQFLIKRAIDKAYIKTEIYFVSNGEDLLERLLTCNDENIPDLILLDLNMPEMSGIEALKKIKENEKNRKIPVVILTTSDNENDMEQCYELGIQSYVTKPQSFDELVKCLENIILEN